MTKVKGARVVDALLVFCMIQGPLVSFSLYIQRTSGIKLKVFPMPPKKRAAKGTTGAEPASKTQRQDDNGEGPSTRSEPEQANGSPSDEGSNDESV